MFFDVLIGVTSSAVGAFLGFVGALYLQARNDKRIQKKRDDLILRNVRDEIFDISSTLSKYLEKQIPLDDIIQTPNWDAALYSGAILEFIENPLYTQTISIYSRIKCFNNDIKNLSKENNLKEIENIVDASVYIANQAKSNNRRN